jgi:NADPH:quinone reductase-like Zn-dependent oxidoreductase
MKAIVQYAYGAPGAALRLEEVPAPVAGDGDVLIRVGAAGVNPLDWHFVVGTPLPVRMGMGMRAPKPGTRRGVDVAGRVEAVGKDVKAFRPGDDVFGWCSGAFAEYARTPEDHVVAKPTQMTYEEAAAAPVAAVTALRALRDVGKLQSGQRLLINGASGGVGSYGVQIAKAMGSEVTGVCSTKNLDLVKSLGADHVVDYTREDFAKDGRRYNLVFDNAGSRSLSTLRGVLTPGGTLVYNSGASMPRIALAMILSRMGRRVHTFLAEITHDDLVYVKALIEAGKLRSAIDRTYPLSETAAAIAYVWAGHARGKVVVTA